MRPLPALVTAFISLAAVAQAQHQPGPTASSTEVQGAVTKARRGDIKDLVRLADGGNPDAQFFAGLTFLSGVPGVPKDEPRGCEYEKKASRVRADAMHLVGECYRRGVGGAADPAKAKAAYQAAIDKGYRQSKCALGRMLVAEGQEAARGLSLCKEAATAGDVAAQLALGDIYFEGKAVKPDHREARRWYEMAAKQKQPRAARTLGVMYDTGDGGSRDKKKAMELWKTAEAAGDRYAPLLVADRMFEQLTPRSNPKKGKYVLPAGTPPSYVDDVSAWYDEVLKRDPRPESQARAKFALNVLSQLKSAAQLRGQD
jgi:TPR repeat protein